MKVVGGAAYLPYDSLQPPPTTYLAQLVNRMKNERSELLLGCDANSHHIGWGSTDTNSRGYSLSEFITSENLLVLYRESEPTSRDAKIQEVLDS